MQGYTAAARPIAAQEAGPPHMQGYTGHIPANTGYGVGPPAHAGIHPARLWASASDGGFPRTCRDTPDRRLFQMSRRIPPHPQGYTVGRRHRERQRRGPPAPAGMHLWSVIVMIPPPRFPRTRRDTPWAVSPAAGYLVVPLHPQGYTCPLRRSPDSLCGSPAPAGIHRRLWTVEPLHGSPAPAGIHPSRTLKPFGMMRFPRTHGDTPIHYVAFHPDDSIPPHPQG